MESALIGGAFAIVGGLLGYVFSSIRDTKASHRERIAKLRERQIEALIAFTHASNDLNRSRQRLNMVVKEMSLARREPGAEYRLKLEDERQEAFREIYDASTRASTEALSLELLAPYMRDQVYALLVASSPESYDSAKADFAKRQGALDDLFAVARAALELTDDARKGPSARIWAKGAAAIANRLRLWRLLPPS